MAVERLSRKTSCLAATLKAVIHQSRHIIGAASQK
jgi:hypothetical protein